MFFVNSKNRLELAPNLRSFFRIDNRMGPGKIPDPIRENLKETLI